MPIKYISSNTSFKSVHVDQVHDKIPVGQYYVRIDRMGDLYLEKTEWKEEHVIYGNDVGTRVHRCINAFINNPGRNVGFAFMGDSGSGKSLTMRKLALTAMKQFDIPIFIVDSNISGQVLTDSIRNFAKEAVIVFDEFEKIYSNKDSLNSLLPFFDGVNTETRFMILITGNDNIGSQYFYNRPGRIHYLYQYGRLSEGDVREFLEKQLNDKTKIEEILMIREISSLFSYDILRSIVNECNLYQEMPLKEVIEPLALDIGLDNNLHFICSFYINGKNVAYTNVGIGIDEIINYRKTGHASKFSTGLFFKPIDLLEIILSDKNNKDDSPLSNIVHRAYIFSEDSIQRFLKENDVEDDECSSLSNEGIAELASKNYALIGHSGDNSEEHATLNFKEGIVHKNFNLEGFTIPLGENIQIEFLPKRNRYQMSNYLK